MRYVMNLFNQGREFSKDKIISAERLCCCNTLLLPHCTASSGRLVSLIQPYYSNHITMFPNLQIIQTYMKHSFALSQPTGASSSPWHHLKETSKTCWRSRSYIRSIRCSFQIYSCASGKLLLESITPQQIQWGQSMQTLVGNLRALVLALCPFAFPFCSAPTLFLVYTVRFAGRNSLLLCVCIIRPVSKHCFDMNNNNKQLFNPWAYSKRWKLYSQKFKPFNEL